MREGGEMRRFLVLYNPGSGTDSGRAIAERFKEIVKGDNASHQDRKSTRLNSSH